MTTRHSQIRIRGSSATVNGESYSVKYGESHLVREGHILCRGTEFRPAVVFDTETRRFIETSVLTPIVGGIQITFGTHMRAFADEFMASNGSHEGMKLALEAVSFVHDKISHFGYAFAPELFTTDEIVARGGDTYSGKTAVLAALLALVDRSSKVYVARGSLKVEGGVDKGVSWVEAELDRNLWYILNPRGALVRPFAAISRLPNDDGFAYVREWSQALRPAK